MEAFTHAFIKLQTGAILEVVKFIEEELDKRDDKRDALLSKALEDRDSRIRALEARVYAMESDVGTPPPCKTAFDSPVSVKAPATTSEKNRLPVNDRPWKKCKRGDDMLMGFDDESGGESAQRGRALSPRTELMEARRIVEETEPVNFETTHLNTQDFDDLISRPSMENKI
jgi:hypothetical protein